MEPRPWSVPDTIRVRLETLERNRPERRRVRRSDVPDPPGGGRKSRWRRGALGWSGSSARHGESYAGRDTGHPRIGRGERPERAPKQDGVPSRKAREGAMPPFRPGHPPLTPHNEGGHKRPPCESTVGAGPSSAPHGRKVGLRRRDMSGQEFLVLLWRCSCVHCCLRCEHAAASPCTNVDQSDMATGRSANHTADGTTSHLRRIGRPRIRPPAAPTRRGFRGGSSTQRSIRGQLIHVPARFRRPSRVHSQAISSASRRCGVSRATIAVPVLFSTVSFPCFGSNPRSRGSFAFPIGSKGIVCTGMTCITQRITSCTTWDPVSPAPVAIGGWDGRRRGEEKLGVVGPSVPNSGLRRRGRLGGKNPRVSR